MLTVSKSISVSPNGSGKGSLEPAESKGDNNYSKTDEKKKPRHTKKSAMKHTMDGKNRKNSNRVAHTERNASGRNWEIFKSLIFNDAPSEPNSGKENVQKKQAPLQKPRRKSQGSIPVTNDSLPACVRETEVYKESMKKLTKQVAMDCEMVGIGDGTESMIARVSIVNKHGFCVYDKYVKPREPVQDYRTKVSGIRPHHLQNGEEFDTVQKEVADILRGRILVGHAIKHDLDVLFLSHPRKCIRDTSRFKPFRKLSMGNTPSLKKLADKLLGREIQIGEHSSVEDARAAMHLYMLYRNKWESEFYSKL